MSKKFFTLTIKNITSGNKILVGEVECAIGFGENHYQTLEEIETLIKGVEKFNFSGVKINWHVKERQFNDVSEDLETIKEAVQTFLN